MKKSFAKLMAAVVALCLLVTTLSLPTVAFADTWDGSSVSASLAGEGTEEAPYLIASAADFAYFANQSRGGNNYSGMYVQLNDDISLDNVAISPLGGFNGTFDGKGHEISGIKITSSSGNQGFFIGISAGTIKNLTLTGSITSTGSIIGGFAGYVSTATFTNCVNNLNVTGSLKVGGFCGTVQSGGNVKIIHCTNNGTITATNTTGYSFLGGLIGEIQQASTSSYGTVSILYSQNTGAIVATSRIVLAGLVGQNRGALTVENCINSGSVTGLTQIGGIVANVNNDAISLTVKNTINVGTLRTTRTTGATAHIGGILGYYAENAKSETFENAFYRDSDYDFNGANDGQTSNTPRGTAKNTASEWTDGTIVALLNGDAETPIFEQGELYPVFYVNKCTHENISSEWSTDAKNHWHVCNDCGEKLDDAAHTASDWIIDTAATEEATGLKHKECTVCGYVLEEQVIPVYNPYAWDGSVSESIAGEGTEESPYLIATGADLAYFAAQVNGGNDYSGKYIKLTADIDLNNIAFTPIGNGSILENQVIISSTSHCFKGIFDGGNYTISGLNVDTGATVSAGLFGAAYNATIKNLNVTGSVKGTKGAYGLPVGGLLGCANNVTITGCSFDGTVESTNTNQNAVSAAGLVSNVSGGTLTIDKCSVSGTIIGFGRSGGILGQVNGGFVVTIKNSFCDAEVTGIYDGYEGTSATAGGLVGFLNNGTITVKDSFFAGTAPTARASGMAGPIINHHAGGVFSCINTYYDSDKNAAESAGYEYGTPATSEEFADGTVLALLNGDAEEPVFEQGEEYPILIVKCEHKDTQSFEEIPATCIEPGHKAYTICNDCGEVIEGEDAEIPVNPDNHSPAEAVKENEIAATYTADGSYDEVVYCSVCKAEISRKTVKVPMKVGTFKITYNLNGGKNNSANPASFKSNAAVTLKTPTRTGYKFEGWYKDSGFKSKITTISKGTAKNVTVYAKWSKITYKLTYKLNGGKNGKNPSSFTVTSSTITLKNPTRAGYKFGGWFTDSKFKNKITKITKGTAKNITLYAKWSVVTYKLTYKLGGGKNGKNPKSYKVTTKTFTLKNATRKGYTFKGWYSDSKFKKKVTKVAKGSTGNKTLYAKWAKK